MPDPRLLSARDIARAALREITPVGTVGAEAGYTTAGDDVVSLRFATTLPGYPGWFWTVSVAAAGDAAPTVLEAGLLPGDDALLAPDWVPWAVRLAEYRTQQESAARAGEPDDGDAPDEDSADEDLDDVDDLDAADFDEDGSPLLHSGDLDGVDIDEDAADEDDDTEDDDTDGTEDAPGEPAGDSGGSAPSSR